MQHLNVNYLPVIWFLFCWVGYHFYSRTRSRKVDSLTSVMQVYRRQWANQIVLRDNHHEDVASISVLERAASFFASTSLIMLAALLAALKAADSAVELLQGISFRDDITVFEFELIIFAAIFIFTYAFFKMSWTIRLYSFVVAMVGALPRNLYAEHKDDKEALATPIAETLSLAAYHFNTALRSFYFSIALFTWLITPWALILSSLVVVYELYRREFRSNALRIMQKVK